MWRILLRYMQASLQLGAWKLGCCRFVTVSSIVLAVSCSLIYHVKYLTWPNSSDTRTKKTSRPSSAMAERPRDACSSTGMGHFEAKF